MILGFSHAYHLHLSLFPWDDTSFRDRLDKTFSLMRAAGATSFRPHIPWNRVEPLIERPHLSPEQVTDDMVAQYADGTKGIYWNEMDMMMKSMEAQEIAPLLCLGVAYFSQLPWFNGKKNMLRFDPSFIKEELYLGHIYLHARAVVRRYKDRCKIWQLENELNGGGEIGLFEKWRLGMKWFSRRFQARLMEILHRAVKEEDPLAFTTHNFAIMPVNIPKVYTWKKTMKQWNKYCDITGIDLYPNYFQGFPVKGRDYLKKIIDDIRALSLEKPIYVLETGYPVQPRERGFSEENQAEYYRQCIEAAHESEIDALYFYCFVSQEGSPGAEWCSRKKFNDIQDWWGLFRTDGSARPAYDYLADRHIRP